MSLMPTDFLLGLGLFEADDNLVSFQCKPSAELRQWCRDNLKKPVIYWNTSIPLRYYASIDDDENDAILFKLRWGDDCVF